ncbi:MAG: methyltransferase domain-containing protein [Anaerolineales bacterium]|jgi:2-polyprenyl-6-hydroxyphenyl methylase/3-demethylubiquinone-9 3-methyltransferase
MPLHIDPERNEVRALKRVTNWRDKRVLDIGCGDGRLSLRLARLGALVHGIDPDRKLILKARTGLPNHLAARVRYRVGKAGGLAFRGESFDLVVFSWSF